MAENPKLVDKLETISLSYDYVKISIDYLQGLGIDEKRILSELDINFDNLPSDRMLTWTVKQYGQWVSLLKQFGDTPAIAIRLGQEYNISAHGQLGQIALCSKNIWQTIDLLHRYTALRNRLLSMTWQKEGNYAVLEFKTVLKDDELNQFAIEIAVSTINCLLRFCLKNLGLSENSIEVDFVHAKPSYFNESVKLLRCLVKFNTEKNLIRLPYEICNLPFRSNNQAVLQLIAQQCEALLADTKEQELVPKVRHILINSVRRFPSQDELAAQLLLAPRTFRQRLKDENTNYQNLLAEVRFSLAKNYLGETDWPIEVVASMLGFSERSSFSAAFKKWSKVSPIHYRRSIDK